MLKLFLNFVGSKPVGQLSRKDCKDFKLTLEKLPPKWQARFKDKDIRDIAALDLPAISPATVNRLFSLWVLGELFALPSGFYVLSMWFDPNLEEFGFNVFEIVFGVFDTCAG